MKKQTEKNDIKKSSLANNVTTSPISRKKLVSEFNALTLSSLPNYSNGQKNSFTNDKISTLDLLYVISELENIMNISNLPDFLNKIYALISNKIDSKFGAIGIYKEGAKCLDLKLQDKNCNNYVSKIFIKDENNPIIRAFLSRKTVFTKNESYLKLSYYKKYSTIILPLISAGKCFGVMIIEDENAGQNIETYSLLSYITALVIDNFELSIQADAHANTDSLTRLLNHRGFQEVLSAELESARINKHKTSILIMDINNISKINRELGHDKGDEVIKVVAEKIKQNVREGDIVARYGGDEIAIILPKTDTAQAKYLAEYLTYSLSCCFIDNVGPIKVSVGIATYPDCSDDKEKLLVLVEQAMYISLAKGYKDGMSAIISSADFNFWDDIALKSYAEVLLKRHSQLGLNFEEELISKFHSNSDKSIDKIRGIATSLAGAIDAKDPYTKGHSTSVSKFSEALARAINLPEEEIERISLGALLHDVGKIGIPENVLKKEGPLSDDEWKIMRQHPTIGVEKVIQPNTTLRDLIPIVKYHHERIDGKGYPEGLSGNDIPLAARIVAIADTYHALISDRPYRKGMDIEKAIAILEEGAGSQWDENLIRTFIRIAPSLGI